MQHQVNGKVASIADLLAPCHPARKLLPMQTTTTCAPLVIFVCVFFGPDGWTPNGKPLATDCRHKLRKAVSA